MKRASQIALQVALGPLWYMRRAPFRGLTLLLLVIVLTLATQTGGLVLWLALPLLGWLYRRVGRRALGVLAATAGFLAIYLAVNLTVVPWAAARLGREALPCFGSGAVPLRAHSPLFCLTNRNYAPPRVRRLLGRLALEVGEAGPGRALRTLDAGFPFLDGFPMLPHLSHRGGRDVDLALFWRDAASGQPVPPPSPFGYWGYAGPRTGEAQPCRIARSWLRWDLDRLQSFFAGAELDETRTAALLRWLAREGPRHGLDTVLIEPHLPQRLGVAGGRIRFQGCRAARHDDHMHLRLR